MPGVQGLLTERFQNRVQVEQVAATAVSDVGKLATANPGQNGVVTHSKPFGQVAGIDEDWRHRRFLLAWSVMPGVTIRSAPYGSSWVGFSVFVGGFVGGYGCAGRSHRLYPQGRRIKMRV